MELTFRRKVAGAAAGLALAAGAAGGAYAVSNRSSGDRQAFLNDVAKRLNVSPQKLRDAFAAALAARRQQYGAPGPSPGGPFPGPGGPGGPPPFGHPPPPGPVGAELDAAAKYLGLTDAQLLTRLRSGRSLAQVAADQNKSVDGLKNALDAEFKKQLDQIVNAKPGLRPRLGMRRFRRHW